LFYRTRISQESEEEDILAPDLLNMPAGAVPQLIQLASWQDEIARVTNEVVDLVRRDFPRQHILILHANWNGVKNLIHAICQKLGRHAAADPKFDYPGNYIRVTTLNAGAGLESPIVFLVGLHQLFEEEHSLRISDEEREELILENTRKIYMAITRAGQRLIFTYVGGCPEILIKMLGKK
jgi:superfamily I DNA/RNA helicase